YDIKGSQTRLLIEEFEDAIAQGADLDLSVLEDYAGKDTLAARYGISREVFKRAEHAPKFGAGFPHRSFREAWGQAGRAARETIEAHGWGHGQARFRTWEERVVRELLTMARVAYEVATDDSVQGLDDP